MPEATVQLLESQFVALMVENLSFEPQQVEQGQLLGHVQPVRLHDGRGLEEEFSTVQAVLRGTPREAGDPLAVRDEQVRAVVHVDETELTATEARVSSRPVL